MTSSVQTDKTMICSNCRNPNAQGARFCNNCGTTLPTTGQFQDETTLAADNEATLESQSKKDPLIGLTIEGKYRLESLIGAGGMGAVYRATRLLIGDEVAIKILHNERIVDPHASERFSREARAAARLKHPNAVSIYDFGVSSEGLQYLVMELIEGRSLREVTRREGAIDAATAAEVTSQICAALE
jgi:serine/threonine protein kinase